MFRDNTTAQRYELDHDGGPSFARYRESDGARLILHVETPDAVRGQGHAAKLMDAMVAEARAKGVRLQPICGYAVAWFRRHKDAQDVLA